MRALIQRVKEARVTVAGQIIARIGHGLLVYVGVAAGDDELAAGWLADKVANLRVFGDDDGKLNRSVLDVRGGVLAVPNFTLQADARKGRRPSFTSAAQPDCAKHLHDRFVEALRTYDCPVGSGLFGAEMLIDSVADGPVNIVLDTPEDTNEST
ncbi:MAG: D-aminoacyl-tRNA deacylase [Planctomycetota bacterium]|jgi:D-tyrosyl-tRNA(Tyr) deacylase